MMQELFTYTKAQWQSKVMLDPARLNQACINQVQRGPTLNEIFPK